MDVTRVSVRLLAFAVVTTLPAAAAAQPLGTFTWQQQPYCNRLTFTITFTGQVFTLDGFDDGCGAAVRSAATGVASINPNGSASLGISIVASGGGARHLDATIDLTTFSGTWIDDGAFVGSFAFNGTAPGNPRPSPLISIQRAGGYSATSTFGGGSFYGFGHRGTGTTPAATRLGDTIARLGGGGHTGESFHGPTAQISLLAAEDWTPAAAGTRMSFSTTPFGEIFGSTRMLIDADGFVGIGTGMARPGDLLEVNGNIRIDGCLKNSNGGTIIGTCASDERFKRDVRAYPDVLNRVASLRPVEFSWRVDAYPGRGFGPDREAGLLAQEVEHVLPELVTTDADGFKAVNYSQLPLLAIQAIRELKGKNDGLEARVAELAARLAALEASHRR